MRSVRQSGTSPELAVRAALTSLGIAFSTNVQSEPGSPDIWLTESDVPIFVHGCFWHRHQGCELATTPNRNREFWLAKFGKNIERDARTVNRLEDMGYIPITIWQCEAKVKETLREILLCRISGGKL